MSHTQPSPTGAVTPGHAHLAIHPQVNGHVTLQSQGQKVPLFGTAQKIAALNEQVWLQIGMSLTTSGPARHADTWSREPHRVDG
jgi:glucose repression mediator protein